MSGRSLGEGFAQRKTSEASAFDEESESRALLAKHTDLVQDEAGTTECGRSTLPQTTFNSVNTLIGVGMLTLPLAMKYSGWLVGTTFFIFSALSTSYTAKLLAKCLEADETLVTFGDIAYVSYGARFRFMTSLLFTLELLACCVALMILFADSLEALLPGLVGIAETKFIFGIVMIPLTLLPLRYLSISSILGIVSCFLIVSSVIVDGLIKPHALGSLWEPAPTRTFPQDWRLLPLASGLLMAPWGGVSKL